MSNERKLLIHDLLSLLLFVVFMKTLPLCETSTPKPPVKCNVKSIAKSQTEYLMHETNTTEHRFHTKLDFKLGLNRVSCFQVDLKKSTDPQMPENANNTTNTGALKNADRVTSFFYSFSYHGYQEEYPVRVGDSYDFAIPEIRSDCRCYCPTSEQARACTSNFDGKYCTAGEICIQRWHGLIAPRGCESKEGNANLCCQISIRPYRNKEFASILLNTPVVTAFLKIQVHVLFDGEWVEFKKYSERVDPTQNSLLQLNGDNQLHLNIETSGARSHVPMHIGIGSKRFYYELNAPFALKSEVIRHPFGSYHYLVKSRGRWVLENNFNPAAKHMPSLTNCHEQLYTDRFDLQGIPHVIRNSSGALADKSLQFADDIQSIYKDQIQDIQLKERLDHEDKSVIFTFHKVPTIGVSVFVEQKLSIISHVHASFFDSFHAKICLDKNKNRYLNVTIVNGFGRFLINIYRDSKLKSKDLRLNAFASLPLATNHTYFLPLPSIVDDNRYVCIHPDEKPIASRCKWALFETEPVDWYEVSHVFLPTEGNCPGCNVYKRQGFASFVDYLNPKNWFKGVSSFSEGVALALQIGLYVIIALVLIAIWRRLLWPLIRWAICNGSNDVYYPRGSKTKKILDDNVASV